MPGDPTEPLRLPRREHAGPPGHDGATRPDDATLDPGTVLVPTRFLAETFGPTADPGAAPAICDGRRSIAEVADAAGVDLALTTGLLSRLYTEGLLGDVGDAAPVPALAFLEHARALCARWRRAELEREGADALEARLDRGEYSRRLAVGFLVEVTHVVRGAAGHIAAAVAHTSDPALSLALSQYLEDEHWHGELMERALRAAGLDDDAITRAVPLPETLAVLDSWRRAAHTDLLLYGGLVAITESGPDDASFVEAHFRATVAQGVLPEAAWRPYFEHALGDGALDHVTHSRRIFGAAGPLSARRRDSLRRQLLSHVEAVLRQERAIVRFYAAPDGPPVHELRWTG